MSHREGALGADCVPSSQRVYRSVLLAQAGGQAGGQTGTRVLMAEGRTGSGQARGRGNPGN